jgi:hypothetical protein
MYAKRYACTQRNRRYDEIKEALLQNKRAFCYITLLVRALGLALVALVEGLEVEQVPVQEAQELVVLVRAQA